MSPTASVAILKGWHLLDQVFPEDRHLLLGTKLTPKTFSSLMDI